jgi:hypothetical protein
LGPAGYCSSFRAEIIAAMIPSTRLRPSSIAAHYHFRRVFASGMLVHAEKTPVFEAHPMGCSDYDNCLRTHLAL